MQYTWLATITLSIVSTPDVRVDIQRLLQIAEDIDDNTKLKVLEEQLQTVLANTTESHFEVKEELADL